MEFITSLVKYLRRHPALIFILILASILRFWQLGSVPHGVTHDEVGYIFNSYSLALTGKNIFGESFPFLTWIIKGGVPFMPVPIYLSAPVFWLLSLSAFSGRFVPALLGVFDVFLLYILVRQLSKNTTLSLLSALFLAISPWHLHFSRSAYDPNYSLFFYLLGIVIFLYEIRLKRVPIFSLLAFFLAVFSYRGMSIIAFPLMVTLALYASMVLKAQRKTLIMFAGGAVLIMLCLVFVVVHYGDAYSAEGKILFSNPKIQEKVDKDIRESQGPLFIRRVFLNKPTLLISQFRENYIKTYSPEYLLLYTESNAIYSIWSRGRIYFIDGVFILLGILYLFRRYKKQAFFVTSLLLIGGLPGGIGGMPYSARNLFLSLIFPIFTAGGVLLLLNVVSLKRIKYILYCLIAILYMYLLGSYLFDYYGKYAIQNAEPWAKSLKDVSNTINNNKDKYDQVLVGPSSLGDFLVYSFYTKISARTVQREIKKGELLKNYFQHGNVAFQSDCPGASLLKKAKKTLILTRGNCLPESTPSAVIREYYQNIVWKIYK